MTKLSIIVPCYNEAEVISLTNERIFNDLGNLENIFLNVIYVNDGSNDGTEDILEALAEKDTRISIIHLARNFGHQSALTAGLNFADGDVVAILDADLQDPPNLVISMLEKWKSGADIVYGVRQKRKEFFLKTFSYAAFYRVWKVLSEVPIPLDSGDFCLMDKRVVDSLKLLPERLRFHRGLRAWVGFNHEPLFYERFSREAGATKYSFLKLVNLALDGIFGFSLVPLRFISILGIIASLISTISIIFILLQRIIGFTVLGVKSGDVPGYASLMLAICFIGGVQLLGLGILGEYIGRIYLESKARPSFIVKRRVNI